MRSMAFRACMLSGPALALAWIGSTARADILYDALYVNAHTGSTSYLTNASMGGANILGEPYDSQSADDFALTQTTRLSSVTFDMVSELVSGNGSLPDSVLVEFYSDNGGLPNGQATASVTLDTFASVRELPSSGTWGASPIYRIGLDLSAFDVVLASGNWWVSISSASDDNWYYHLAAQRDLHQTGAVTAARDGGNAHGTGYLGFFGTSDWVSYPGDNRGDLAMRIEGQAVPAAWSFGIIGSAGLLTAARRRR